MSSRCFVFVLYLLYNIVTTINGSYIGIHEGELKDPAGADDFDTSIVLINGMETPEEEAVINKKLKNLDHIGPGEASFRKEALIQDKQERDENKEPMKRSMDVLSKRLIFDDVKERWTKAIVPYKFDTTTLNENNTLISFVSITGSKNIAEIKKAMALYEFYTCFRFYEWNENTQAEHGLDHNNYIFFKKGSGCWSFLGNLRKKTGGQPLSCCAGSTCVHEIGHALGFHHEQKSPFRDDVLRVNEESINPKYLSQYSKSTRTHGLVDFPYNLNSYMHYAFWMFRQGKGDTMTVLDPKMKYLVSQHDPSQFYMFKELMKVYRCTDDMCQDFNLDCQNDGYLTIVEGQCQCRCVKGLDPSTGCTTLTRENELDKTLKWPLSKFALLRAANSSCPENAKEGSLTHKSDGGFISDSYEAMGDHENLNFCTFDQENRTANSRFWPKGEYCLTKAGGACPENECPEGWTENPDNNHCYKMFTQKVKGFNGGVTFCSKEKAYIVSIQDRAENTFVDNLINREVLIGASDQKEEGVFLGPDGQEVPFTRWDYVQPDNYNDNEDCVVLRHWNGKWNDVSCSSSYPVVCEMSKPGFEEGYIEFDDDSVTQTGILPNVISDSKTKLEFCCRNDGNRANGVMLPTANRFILWQTNAEGCQSVKDTIAVSNHFAFRMKQDKNVTISGATPLGDFVSNVAYAYFCVYQPVSKDCGQIIELTDAAPTAVVTSPYFPNSYHTNMECTWFIKSQPNTRIVLSFETFEIPNWSDTCDDWLEVRFGLPEQPGVKYCGHEFKTSVYSFKNYIVLILDSKSYQHGKRFKAKLTMIKDEDLCYYGMDKGWSYRGNVGFTRNFKSCLPWDEVTNCDHSTNNTNDDLSGLEGNYCRNPQTGTDPWCYTTKDTCVRDYCDVCGLGNCHDVYDNCATLLEESPDYCTNTTSWNGVVGCAQTCGFCDRQTKQKYADLSCSNPSLPLNAKAVDPNKQSTSVGKSYLYVYPSNEDNVFGLKCFSDGSWSTPYECPEGWILDEEEKECNKIIEGPIAGLYGGTEICRQYGGYVAVIKTAEENIFVKKLVVKSQRDSLIGLTDRLDENTFIWFNGDNSTYRHWKSGQPNNYRNQDCTVMNPNGGWYDVACETFKAVACQIPLPVSYCEDGTTACEKFRELKNVAVGKSADQSSTYSTNTADLAVDGTLDTGFSHTEEDASPWWQVDLEGAFKIKKILISNRQDEHGSRLRNLKVTIGETKEDMKDCIFYEGPSTTAEQIELQCAVPLYGRYVKLQMSSRGFLQLQEVKVLAYTDLPEVTCPDPVLPKDAIQLESLQAPYRMGNVLSYKFAVNDFNIFSITCLSSGQWTYTDCPDGWTIDNDTNKCNKVFKNGFLGRYNGLQICRKYNGYVATIQTEEENNFATTLLQEASTDVMIDINDQAKEGTFIWSNGLPVSYTNWKKGEPNNYYNEDCTVLQTNGEWRDVPCHWGYPAVLCQISMPVSSCDDGTTSCEKFETFVNVAEGKSTKQSTTLKKYKASNAVDGKLETMTHTKTETEPWWQVDLDGVYKIKSVVIANRDSYGSRFKNVRVTIGENEADMTECSFYEGPGQSSEVIEMQCNAPLFGRYVRLQLTGRGIIQVAEINVKAYSNVDVVLCSSPVLPLHSVAIGSTPATYPMGTIIQYKFSGNDLNVYSIRCLSSGEWTQPKDCPEGWTLDATAGKCNKAFAKKIQGFFKGTEWCRRFNGYPAIIKNKAENDVVQSLAKKANKNVLIGLSDRLREGTFVWLDGSAMTFSNWRSGEPNDYNGNEDCSNIMTYGQWNDLRCESKFDGVACQITLPVGTCADGSLDCDKFKTLTNVARGKTATTSSVWSEQFNPNYVVDGNVKSKKSCTHSKLDTNPWWQVDLGSVYTVQKVVITNRVDGHGERLHDVKIYVGETVENMQTCTSYDGPGTTKETIELACSVPISGQFVKIQIEGQEYLQLCEVAVYAFTT